MAGENTDFGGGQKASASNGPVTQTGKYNTNAGAAAATAKGSAPSGGGGGGGGGGGSGGGGGGGYDIGASLAISDAGTFAHELSTGGISFGNIGGGALGDIPKGVWYAVAAVGGLIGIALVFKAMSRG